MARTEVSGSQIKDGSVALSGAASPTGNADVSGVLPAGNGGTGLSSPGASGNVLTSDGTGWTTAAPTGGGGGSSRVISTVTSATTLGSTAGTQYVAYIGSGGSVTLPTAVGNTSWYTIKNNDTVAKTIATAPSSEANWSNVTALFRGNGDDASTVFTESTQKYTWTASTGIRLSTSVKKYGTASIYFGAAGNNSVIQPVAGNSYPGFGTADFTVEMWVYSTNANQYFILDGRPFATNGVYPTFYVAVNQTLRFLVSAADRITGTTVMAQNTWHHVALSRTSGVTKMFLNGVQEGSSYTDANNYLTVSGTPTLGNSAAVVYGVWPGYMDDIRITHGVGRYTATFTPPTELPIPDLIDGSNGLTLAPNQAVELASSGSNWSIVSDSAALPAFTTTPTSASTTTLTVASTQVQEFTGTTTHTVKLPTTGVVAGRQFTTINSSTGLVTVQSSSAASIIVLVAASSATFTALVSTPTTAAHWRVDYSPFTSSGSSFALARTGDAFLSVDSGGAKVILGSTGTDAFVGTQSAHSINVRTGNTTRATIDTSGNLSVTGSITAATVPVVTTTGTQTLSNKVINESTVAVGTVGATVTLGLTGTIQTATLTSATACTVTMPAVASGASFVLYLRQPATGTPTTATFTNVRWGTVGAPVITAVLGRMDILTFFSDGTYWYGQYAQGYQY